MSVPDFIKRSLISQFIIMLIFVVSGLIVCSLQTFTLVLWPVNKKWYRLVNCYLVYLHWGQVIFLCDYWAEVELHIHTTSEHWPRIGKEHALMVCNHRNDLDWIVTWMIGDRAAFLQSCKSLVKNESRYIPFIGWSFLLLEFIFVKRDFTKDRESLIKGFQSYGDYPLPSVTLLFCEGTRFTEAKHKKSIDFARKQGIEPLKHHLLPRTKGFTMCIEGFKGRVPAMYDCCVAYDTIKGAQPTLTNILQGRKMVFHLLGKLVLMKDIPNNTEQECADYCYNLYKIKDGEYEYFLKHNTFAGLYDGFLDQVFPRRKWPLIIEMFWLLILGLPSLFYMAQILMHGSTWARMSIAVACFTICLLVQLIIKATETAKGSSYGHHENKGEQQQPRSNGRICQHDASLHSDNDKTVKIAQSSTHEKND